LARKPAKIVDRGAANAPERPAPPPRLPGARAEGPPGPAGGKKIHKNGKILVDAVVEPPYFNV
jgi:hypothetical protein